MNSASHRLIVSSLAIALGITVSALAKDTPEEAAKNEAIRAGIALGGNFEPKPEEGVFVAAGHGLNVVASRDDGKTWKQVFYGAPGGDHGPWAVWNSVAYTQGVFAIAAGWGASGTIIASDDGKNWRHLTGAQRKSGKKPYDMATTQQFIGMDGSFIMPLGSTTPDFGKSWFEKGPYGFKDADGNKVPVDVHRRLACGDHAGGKRIIVIGSDTGPICYSDDLGKSWVDMNMKMKIEPWEGKGCRFIAKGNVFLVIKGVGETALRSVDGGMTWQAQPLGVADPQLSIVGDEFWVTGKTSKASKDGMTWRDLPAETPNGRIAESDKGTLINVSRSRTSILRSEDGGKSWQEVYKFTPKGSGGAQGFADVEFGMVKKVPSKP